MSRFFAFPENIDFSSAILLEEEAYHLCKVLRFKAGDEVQVFDGIGHEWLAEVEEINKSNVKLLLKRELTNTVESNLAITLVQGLIKGEKFEIAIQKATELGVNNIIPLISQHTDIKVSENSFEKKVNNRLERWQRIALEATKQSGRRCLPNILLPVSFSGLITQATSPVIFFSERGGDNIRTISEKIVKPESITAVVGSEGGWSEEEIELAKKAGFYIASLGTRILRAETAGITALALLQHTWGDI
ncbi:MAG: 16S rRNA (uracil(1498)-N(3))-methyltransferase [Blastocatellia bacterium]|nr:16S rRNA (uracil(1498)-N(3))-methyltransferase [Blastocatellia bacterium]